jgi:tellurium resistance protein TerZ
MEQSEEEVDVVATLVRSASGEWTFNAVDEPAQDGQHFMDVLEPTIGNLVRAVIPGAPRRQKVAFAMEKGAVVDLPETRQMSVITAGLGWDVSGGGVDLDVSAVLLDAQGQLVEAIFFGNLTGSGLRHAGDNLTGAGDGDDEQIQCNLAAVPARATQIFFVVSVYTRGVSFEKVRNAYCRIFDASDNEMARYMLTEGGRESSLIMARLFREAGDRWGFQAIGRFSRGNVWKDALPDIVGILRTAPRDLQLRGSSTMAFSGEAGGHGRPEVEAAPRGSGCEAGKCTLQ